jgi:hypothetical protein
MSSLLAVVLDEVRTRLTRTELRLGGKMVQIEAALHASIDDTTESIT